MPTAVSRARGGYADCAARTTGHQRRARQCGQVARLTTTADLITVSTATAMIKAKAGHENDSASPGNASGTGKTSDHRHSLPSHITP